MMRKLQSYKQLRPIIFLFLSSLIVLLGGGATLFWQVQAEQSSYAAAPPDVTGPPSLSAATVDAIFARAGSPMEGTGAIVEQASRQTNIDDAFALAVWWAETNDGEAGVGITLHNPGGVAGEGGFRYYPSYAAGVEDWFAVVSSRYISRGLTSVYTICGPYVATAVGCSAEGWAGKVVTYMARYQGMAPPPPPTVSTTPKPAQAAPEPSQVSKMESPAVAMNRPQTLDIPAPMPPPSHAIAPRTQLVLVSQRQTLFMGWALLLAIVVAMWGAFMRRKEKPFIAAGASVSPMPVPLFANQYSPVLSQTYAQQAIATEQLPFTGNPGAAFAGVRMQGPPSYPHTEQLRDGFAPEGTSLQPGFSLPGQVPVYAQSRSGGLLKRYKMEAS